MNKQIEDRVKYYWTKRAHDFGTVRKNELGNEMGQKWLLEIKKILPKAKKLDILDVGTGTGFFALLLSGEGHRVKGIDLTPAMLEEAKILASQMKLDIEFEQMDAQKLEYTDDSFDVVVSRNLTWTLPDPEMAYKEWFRVLRQGGLLINYDASYAQHVLSQSTQNQSVKSDSPYGHVGMTDALQEENDSLTLTMDVGQSRPDWDVAVLKKIGFTKCRCDLKTGERILGEYDLKDAPMFGIYAIK